MARDASPLSLTSLPTEPKLWGVPLGFVFPSFPWCSLLFCFLISFSTATASLPGIEYDYGISPKFVCTPIPPEADPSCYSPPSVPHGPSTNGHSNGHNGSSRRGVMSDEAKATILHLRESLVRQKETILDQRETIRELTAKLTLCEGFGGHHSVGHHDNHHDSHHDDHHGHHGHHPPSSPSSSSHHGPSSHHENDHHYPHNGHRLDPHHRKGVSYVKHSSFSVEQTGKTLQTLKERLENLQARNSSSSYSSSLRDLLQRKINALEEQLHNHYRGHHDYGHHEEHHGHHDNHHGHHDDHHNEHNSSGHHDAHNNNRHGNGHHENHHDDHHSTGHHENHHDDDDHHNDHHDNSHHDDHHSNGHHDDHHNIGHHEDHHNDHHYNHGHHEDAPHAGSGHSKLDTVLSHLHHRNTDPGNHKKPKNPDAFQIGFPMRTNYMHARMKRSIVNEIFALTVCLWLRGTSGPGLGTPFSYSIPGQANELVLIEWGSNPMELLINDKAVTLPMTMTDGKWHHVCVTWSTRDGQWEAYQDGVKKGSGVNLSAWHPIKPGGIFIMGQEQDTLGGRFDATQSFVGEMSDLQFWSRVLTPSEIYSQASCGGHLTGDVISWSEATVELHGGITKYPFDPCH
ncbi:neuronal pentraxin-2 [Lampris incognitus]|uniref:neuronal pentraxin-2 n=1 Tax=Lampris incognitus TaxID=2546036 RepID=UPI0024B4F7DE|nr:neuronal pentraxin-2 [Lampris incognitus]